MADCYVQSANQEVKFLRMANADFEPGSENFMHKSQTRWQNDLSKKKDKKKFLHEITLKCFNDIKLDLILFQLILVMNQNLKRIYIHNTLMAHYSVYVFTINGLS